MANMSQLATKLGVDLLLVGTELTATEAQAAYALLYTPRCGGVECAMSIACRLRTDVAVGVQKLVASPSVPVCGTPR